MIEHIVPIVGILGIVMGMAFLKKYKISERFAISGVIELILYLFSFPLIYIALIISSIFKRNIDYNTFFAIATLIAMLLLAPSYCYCINKYKKTDNYLLSMIIATVIYLIIVIIVVSIFM